MLSKSLHEYLDGVSSKPWKVLSKGVLQECQVRSPARVWENPVRLSNGEEYQVRVLQQCCCGLSYSSKNPEKQLLYLGWSPPWHDIITYLSQILTFFVLKSGEDEEVRIILMQSKPLVSRFHQNYHLLLVPSPGWGSSGDHCDLSEQIDSNWLSLCLIRNNFRRPGVSRHLSAWKLRFERYKNVWLSLDSGGHVSLQGPRRLEFNKDRSKRRSIWHVFWHFFGHIFWHLFLTYVLTSFSDISSDIFYDIFLDISIGGISSDILFWYNNFFDIFSDISSDRSSDILFWHISWHFFGHFFWHPFLTFFSRHIFWHFFGIFSDISPDISIDISSDILSGIFSDILFRNIVWHFY